MRKKELPNITIKCLAFCVQQLTRVVDSDGLHRIFLFKRESNVNWIHCYKGLMLEMFASESF